jgi:uncharacterized pyridoxal phosphate-containing UPF0001 family protein
MGKEVKETVENLEETKKIELCAISKDYALKKIQEIYEANKDAFLEFDMWQRALQSPVQVNPNPEPLDFDKELLPEENGK